MKSLRERVLSTMKSAETESAFELYMTRTPGYLWALFFRALHVHPIAVTLLSIVIGAASGYFFYRQELYLNVIGMFVLIWANWYDCADGQLARMTGQKTLIGRILDGFAGDVWFFCIYLGITLRLTSQPIPFLPQPNTWGPWIWLLSAWSGLRCHGRQCAVSDYYRNIHLWAMSDESDSTELCDSESLRQEMKSLRWMSADWFRKLYLFFYIIYTEGQENQTPSFQKLYSLLKQKFDKRLPAEYRERFRQESKPLMPMTNILTFDTRVGVLFASLLIGHPWLYMLTEMTVLEYLRFSMIRRHESICDRFYNEISSSTSL